MADEQWVPRPYSNEEFLSFDRLKRAVTSRVLDLSERVMIDEFPLNPDKVMQFTDEEWKRAKEALRTSPGAREAFRKYLEGEVNAKVDNLIKAEKSELGSMGVAEKSL
jgi:hypothetical protein